MLDDKAADSSMPPVPRLTTAFTPTNEVQMTKILKVLAVAVALTMAAASAYAQVGVNDLISSAPRWQRLPVVFVSTIKSSATNQSYQTDTQAPVTVTHFPGTTSSSTLRDRKSTRLNSSH